MIEKIKKDIRENSESYPAIAHFWEIEEILDNNNSNVKNLNKFGHYDTKSLTSYPFYKPITKIINFDEIK